MSNIRKSSNTKRSERESDVRSNNPAILQISELESRYQQRHKECLRSDSKHNSKTKKEIHHYDSQNSSKGNTKRSSKEKQNLKSSRRSKPTESVHQSRMTYPGLCKIVEERNGMIQTYEKQICSLIQQVSGLRKQNQSFKNKQAGFKTDEIKRLREYQASNETNLKELELLKQGISQMKIKVDQLTQQKKSLVAKYNEALKQTEKITVKFNSLLNQSQAVNQHKVQIQNLTEQLQYTKKKYLQSKDAEKAKLATDERCKNLQKKINQYTVKYNEVQADFNQLQLKYIKIQRSNDQLVFHQQENQVLIKALRQQIQDEKNQYVQEVDRMKKNWKAADQLLSHRSRFDETGKSRMNFSQQSNQRQEQLLRIRQNERALSRQKLYQGHFQIHKTEKVCQEGQKRTPELPSLKQMNEKVVMLIQQNNRLCDLIKKKEFDIQCNRNDAIHLKMQWKKQDQTRQKLVAQLFSKEQLIHQKQLRVNELEQILGEINIDLNSVKEEVQSYRLHVQKIEQEKQKLQRKQYNFSSETQKLKQEVQFYKQKFDSVSADNKEKSSKVGKLQILIDQYTKRVKLLQQLNEHQRNQIRAFQERISVQKQQIYERQLQKSAFKCRQSDLQKRLDELAKQLYYQRQKNLQLEQKNNQHQNAFQRIDFDKKITLQQAKQEYEQKERIMRNRIVQLEKEKQITTKNADTIVKKARGLQTEVPYLNNRVKQLQRKLSEEQDRSFQAAKELTILKQDSKSFEQINRKYENSLKEIKILKETLDSVEQKLGKAEGTITTLTSQLTNLIQNNISPDITLKSRLQSVEESRYQVNRELDSSKLAIEILKSENQNLQRIMADQLNKRKSIIEDLVRQKQGLYQQIRKN